MGDDVLVKRWGYPLNSVKEFLHLLLLVLATYAVSLQVTKLGGPGGVFRALRAKAKGSTKEWLSCPICFGPFISALLVTYAVHVLHWLSWSEWLVYVFAVSGGNALLNLFDPV